MLVSALIGSPKEKNNKSFLFDKNFESDYFLRAFGENIQEEGSGIHKTGGFFPHAITLGDFNNDGNIDFAIKLYYSFISLFPNCPEGYFYLGLLFKDIGDGVEKLRNAKSRPLEKAELFNLRNSEASYLAQLELLDLFGPAKN